MSCQVIVIGAFSVGLIVGGVSAVFGFVFSQVSKPNYLERGKKNGRS